jgi:hypothetical protein
VKVEFGTDRFSVIAKKTSAARCHGWSNGKLPQQTPNEEVAPWGACIKPFVVLQNLTPTPGLATPSSQSRRK